MEPEVVAAWISDQHVLLHACSDPNACQLPLEYSISPSRRRYPDVLDNVSPTAKRRRAPLADVDLNAHRKMPSSGEPDLRRSPKKKGSKQPGNQDLFASDNADTDTAIYRSDLQATPQPRKVLSQQQPIFPAPMSFTTKLSASDRQSVASGLRK
ncbi:hypothetical protein DL766_007176 [Monosporascus sp. MC13-8B]|uniref:Uncharacterized protein n=1 Tax=Monosporascus cannonballus TaxID=155416 RepID=A0ABY0HJ04_9PEZI|nr:hypothetical protein DL762_001936 [Monosporascus cannonballus]RYO91982.1 hypothetical protein DL763_004826 [Monosporascus cannonballus]RYP25050.1 hypothetical protein DL766_007176 [Monosporascus sp. MC13-8B]